MKGLLCIVMAAGLLLLPLAYRVESARDAMTPPPVAQALVREGDFALSLVEALEMGTANDEAEAESMMASAGIAPKNGWLADYPVTPDIIGELQDAVGMAADSGGLAMTRSEAVTAFQTLTADYGLPVIGDAQTQYSENPEPQNAGEYPDPTVINDYYSEEGPPVVSYYPPPGDYYTMYSWVPYPFWWGGFGFSGFFVLNDFHKFSHSVIVKKHGHHNRHKQYGHHKVHNGGVKVVSNHVRDHNTSRVSVVNPVLRNSGNHGNVTTNTTGGRGYDSPEKRAGAASVMERGHERGHGSTRGIDTRGNDRSAGGPSVGRAASTSREQTSPLRGSGASGFSGHGGEQVNNVTRERSIGNNFSAGQRQGINAGSVNAARDFDQGGRTSVDRSFGGGGRSFSTSGRGGGDALRSGNGSGGGRSFSNGGFSRGGGGSMGGGFSRGGAGGFSRGGGGGGGCRGHC